MGGLLGFFFFLYKEETLAFVFLRRCRGRKEISAFFGDVWREKFCSVNTGLNERSFK